MNLIVICADTFRADHLGCYGNAWIRTPNLDQLAREGLVCEAAFAEGLPTINARRVYFTGRHLFPGWEVRRHKGDWLSFQPGWHSLDEEDVTLAEALQEQGFTTALVTDLYHMFKPTRNFHRGFDAWHWIRGQEQDRYITGPRAAVDLAPYARPGTYDQRRFQGLEQYLLNVSKRRGEEEYFVAQVMRAAADWLSDNTDNQPFFMWVDCFDPHEPWDPPRADADAYAPGYEGPELIRCGGLTSEHTPEELRRIRALYAGEVTLVDRWIGHLLERVRSLGLLEDTILVFTSDHGTILGEHGRLHKDRFMLIRPETQLPLIIRHPDRRWAGHRVPGLIHAPDLMPTLMGLLGVAPPDRVTGADFWPLVTGERERLHGEVVTAYGSYASIRTERWNYIAAYKEPDPPVHIPARLYDLAAEAVEVTDVSAEHPEVAARFAARMEEILRR